jgi:predicted metal-dependent enzyme (double-stranded beta helix superfamily)
LKISTAEAVEILQRVKVMDMDGVYREELLDVCRGWTEAVKPISSGEARMAFFRDGLPAILVKQALFEGVLAGILKGNPHPDLRQETFFENELVLYRDPGRLFSLRVYIFGPSEHTSVHDHTSWGVSGSAFGQLEVVRYRREDDRSDPDQAQLALAERSVLWPGEIETTLPLDQGIHRTGNPTEGTTLMVSVYGTPLRRLYIQRFSLENGSVHRMFPPRFKKKMLAEQALQAMGAARSSN